MSSGGWIVADTKEEALSWAREAIAFQLRDLPDYDQSAPLRLILGPAS